MDLLNEKLTLITSVFFYFCFDFRFRVNYLTKLNSISVGVALINQRLAVVMILLTYVSSKNRKILFYTKKNTKL